MPAAGPSEISSTVGPRRLAVWCHTFSHVLPPSGETSTSAKSLVPRARQSLLKRTMAPGAPLRSSAGMTRLLSSVLPLPRLSLSTMANPPSPPVRLPRGGLWSSVNVQPPASVALTTLQPAGAVGASNDSLSTGGAKCGA